MARPGVNIIPQESSSIRTSPTDTGVTFTAIVAERGPTGVIYDCQSFNDFRRTFGERLNWTARYWDAIESFYKYGSGELKIVRVPGGPAAAKADADLLDAADPAVISLTITAVGTGVWYNGIRVTVESDDDDNVRVVVTHLTDPSVNEASLFYDNQLDLVDWSKNSRYIRLALGASTALPAEAVAVALTGGADDQANITQDIRTDTLDSLLNSKSGPGQVGIAGESSAAGWDAILAMAEKINGSAILGYPDTADEATLTTLARTARARGRAGAAFAGYLIEPGVAPGKTKLVAPELAVCAKIAVHDAVTDGWGQNKPVAGLRRGVLQRCLGVSQGSSANWLDEDAVTRLNGEGVNLIREINGQVVIYGWRSLTDPVADPGWVNFGHRRMQTALTAKANAAMEPFVFDEIDGEGQLLGKVNGALVAQVVQPYFLAGSLYGANPQEAYRVDTASVNDDTTAENRELNAAITVVESEFAEEINVYLTKNMISQGVGA